jgi:hypothetical protein
MAEEPQTGLHLKRALLQSVNPHLVGEGFKLNASRDRFVRRRDGIADIFHITCTRAVRGYYLDPGRSVSIDRVEEIFHQTSGFESKTQKDTPTMGTRVGPILNGRPTSSKLLLKSEADINHMTGSIVRIFREDALPYFERWSPLVAIDAELNGDPTKITIHRGPVWSRCSTGIIVARLVGRSDYRELADFYLDVMARNSGGFYLHRFLALIDSLESIEAGSGITI